MTLADMIVGRRTGRREQRFCIFQVPINVRGTLSITARPRGGDWLEDDVTGLAQHGVRVVVSLLCDDEQTELGLHDEGAICAKHDIEFVALPVQDRGVPDNSSEFIAAVHRLASLVRDGSHIAVHCRQSVGRSGVLAVSIAVACGASLQKALDAVSEARGVSVPETNEQLEWLRQNAGNLSEPASS